MGKNMQKGSRLIVAGVLVVVAIACIYAYQSHRSARTVIINQAAKTLLYLPLYVAQDQGFFRDEGIDVTIVTGGGDSQAFAAVIGGSAQFGQGDPMMVPLSIQRGGSGKIIGSVVARVAFWGVSTRQDLKQISDPGDFRGKKVVTYPEPMTIYALQKKNVLDAGLVLGTNATIVQAQFGTELAPLFAGDADITMTIEPVVSQAISRGAHIVYSFPEKYGDYALTGLMVDDKLIADNPDMIQHVANAYQRALSFSHANQDGAISVAEKEFPDIDRAIVASAVRRMLAEETIPKLLTVSKEAYGKAHAVRRSIGDLEKDITYDVAVDDRFAEEAVRMYGR